MTPKDRTDAIRELKDMAYEHERKAALNEYISNRTLHVDRARMLRAVAAELANGEQP